MPRKGSGSGIFTERRDGYLRISRRGPLRMQMAHRAYVNRQLAESGLSPLDDRTEVHHLCRNRACWPPTDFHLLILDARMHEAFEAGKAPWAKRRARMAEESTTEDKNASTTPNSVLDTISE